MDAIQGSVDRMLAEHAAIDMLVTRDPGEAKPTDSVDPPAHADGDGDMPR